MTKKKALTRISVNLPTEVENIISEYWRANHGLKSKAYRVLTEELLRHFKKDEAKLIGAIGTGRLRIIVE